MVGEQAISLQKTKFSILSLCSVGLLFVVPAAYAQDGVVGKESAAVVFDDEPVVVTATRTPVKSSAALAPVTVLNRQEIAESQTDSVPELLRGMPGIDVVQNGGPGTNASIYMRGSNAGHALVLINGRKMGSATLGTVSWQHLPVSQIERIEVVRGPRSTLYGSEAIGGVVQIFTRDRGAGFNVDADYGYGNWNTHQGSMTISGGNKQTNGSISLAAYYTDGYNAKQTATAASAANDSDDDGYQNFSLSAKVGHRLERGTTIEFDLFRAEVHSEFDATSIFDSSDVDRNIQQSMGLVIADDPFDWWHLTVSAGLSRDDYTSYASETKQSAFNTHRKSASLQSDFSLADDHLLTVGVDYMEEAISSTSSYDLSSRQDWALFTQYQGAYADLSWVAGLRAIDNQQFGSHQTTNLELGYRLGDNLRLVASYGTAFKAPTFNDLYFPSSAFGAGNPDLQPEKSKSFEVGVAGQHHKIDWSLRGYQTDIEGLISWSATASNPFYFTPSNVDDARITGLELEGKRSFGRFDLATALTMMEPENRSSGLRLNRRAKTTAKVDLGYRFAKYPANISASTLYQSSRYNDTSNSVRVAGYSITNLTGSYDLDDSWQLRLKVGNLFDKEYETVMATSTPYNAPGRSIFLSLAWRFSQ